MIVITVKLTPASFPLVFKLNENDVEALQNYMDQYKDAYSFEVTHI